MIAAEVEGVDLTTTAAEKERNETVFEKTINIEVKEVTSPNDHLIMITNCINLYLTYVQFYF